MPKAKPDRPSQHWHRLSEVDTERMTAVCSKCGPTDILLAGGGRPGFRCAGRIRRFNQEYHRPHASAKKAWCERCGFVAVHPAQLDVHHRDHNHANNDIANLETVCANCHRLEHAA